MVCFDWYFISQEQKRKEEEARKQKELFEKYKDLFGNRPLVEAELKEESQRRHYVRVEELNENFVGKSVWLRVRVQTSRTTGPLFNCYIYMYILICIHI
jgi:hypothetical protein